MVVCYSTEPMVGKVQAKRLEEDAKSCTNCRYVYSLQVDAAAIITDMLYSLIVDPAGTAIMQP